MKISRKPKFDDDLSIIENISQQRDDNNNRDQRLHNIRRIFAFIRLLALLGLAYWGYTTRETIQAFILDILTTK